MTNKVTELEQTLGDKIIQLEKQNKALWQRLDTQTTRLEAELSHYDAFLIFLYTGIADYNYYKKGEVKQGRYKYLVTAKTMYNLLLTFRSKKGVDSRALPEIYRKLVKEALDNNINSREIRPR